MTHPTNDSPASVEEIFAEFEPYKGKDYGSMTEYRITKFRLDEATARINQLLVDEITNAAEYSDYTQAAKDYFGKRIAELREALKDGGKHE